MGNNLEKITDKIISYLELTENFIANSLPDFAKQLIEYSQWKAQWSYDVAFWFCLLFFTLSIILFVTTIVKEDDHVVGALMCATGTVFIISFCITVGNYSELKMSKIAPKVYFIKVAKDLLRKGK